MTKGLETGRRDELAISAIGAKAYRDTQLTALDRVVEESKYWNRRQINEQQRDAAVAYRKSDQLSQSGSHHRLQAAGGRLVAPESGELTPRPRLSDAQEDARWRTYWKRAAAARIALDKLGNATRKAIDELVLDDVLPWWMRPIERRLGESDADYEKRFRDRAGSTVIGLFMIGNGLRALAAVPYIAPEPEETGDEVVYH